MKAFRIFALPVFAVTFFWVSGFRSVCLSQGNFKGPDSLTYDSLKKARILEMSEVKEKLAKVKSRDVSHFYCCNAFPSTRFLHEGTYPTGSEHEFKTAKINSVLGPFVFKGNVSVYRLIKREKRADSVMVRHILIAYKGADRADPSVQRTKKEARKLADSLKNAIASGTTRMEDLVVKYTDDPGSLSGNLGNYGWITIEMPFIESYKDVGFDNPVGTTVVMESVFGYHVMQVLAKTPEHEGVIVYQMSKSIDPSSNPW